MTASGRALQAALPILAVCLPLAGPAAPGPARAGADGVRIEAVRLRVPSDSHEPQRAALVLRNAGAAAGPVAFTCVFRAGDAHLAAVDGAVAAIPAGATAQAEAIYYGWPRAETVACRVRADR